MCTLHDVGPNYLVMELVEGQTRFIDGEVAELFFASVLALISLGYKQVDAHKAVRQVLEAEPGRKTAEELVRRALKTLI